jgi:DNA primase large subunit
MSAEYLQFVVDAVLAIGVIAFAIAQWRNGKSQLGNDTIQTYKELLEATEKKYAARQEKMQEQLNDQATRLGEMKGILSTKDEQIKLLREVLENRNPELEKILNQVLKFMVEVDKRLSEISEHQKKPFVAEAHTTTTVSKT